MKRSDRAQDRTVSAIILAAGESKRMGQPKMLLSWGDTTVLGRVIEILQAAGIKDILVITGGVREQVEALVAQYGSRTTFNESYTSGEMLSSIQRGLEAQKPQAQATLICLGDQPQVQEGTVLRILQAWEQTGASLLVPSYDMRRGHPWLAARELWDEMLAMHPPETPRDFLNRHAREIRYIEVDNPSVLADLDTPQDYLKYKP